jgi:hypothetical protein
MSHSKIMIEDSIINKLFKNLYNLNSCAKRELLFFCIPDLVKHMQKNPLMIIQ